MRKKTPTAMATRQRSQQPSIHGALCYALELLHAIAPALVTTCNLCTESSTGWCMGFEF